MTILVGKQTRVIVQGITGREGSFYTEQMIAYGTNVVGGVTPSKGGEWGVRGRPIFDSVRNAVETTEANASLIAVAASHAIDAIYEAIDAGIRLIVSITEGIPVLDLMRLSEHLARTGTRLIGPNCPGVMTPAECSIGMIPGYIGRAGIAGVVSRSATLMCEIVYDMTKHNIGQTTLVGIGGDPMVGTNYVEVLEMFEDDHDTEKVVLIGEIGGRMELDAAKYIASHMTKPVIAYIAGKTAPPSVRMGHPGALIDSPEETAAYKIEALRAVGVRVAETPNEVVELLK